MHCCNTKAVSFYMQHVLRELPSSPVSASCCTALLEAYSEFPYALFLPSDKVILVNMHVCICICVCVCVCLYIYAWVFC